MLGRILGRLRTTRLARYLRSLKVRWYLRHNELPKPKDINPLAVKQLHLREFAKLYCAGYDLDICSRVIAVMKMPPEEPRFTENGARLPRSNLQARLFLGRRHTRERLRQLIWKIWRDQHLPRDPEV